MSVHTGGGAWIKRDADKHICPRPLTCVGSSAEARAGDLWRCDECGAVHRVTSIDSGMQWDPINPPAIRWELQSHGHTPPSPQPRVE